MWLNSDALCSFVPGREWTGSVPAFTGLSGQKSCWKDHASNWESSLLLFTAKVFSFIINKLLIKFRILLQLINSFLTAGWRCEVRWAVCTRRWRRFVTEPFRTHGWRWTGWNSQGPNTEELCSGWRTFLRSSTQIHTSRWRSFVRSVSHPGNDNVTAVKAFHQQKE